MLPEELLLLFIDERTGHTLAGPETVGNALAGAMLIELMAAEMVVATVAATSEGRFLR